MNILIVEDDSFKAKSLKDFLSSTYSKPTIRIAPSLVDAIEAVTDSTYDLILVDMAIPSHPAVSGEGSPLSFLSGGLDVLLELSSLERDDPCIVVTQYPEIQIGGKLFAIKDAAARIRSYLGCDVKECIMYNEDSKDWKEEMARVISTL
ncbi:response regulator [Pseudomonas xanthosomatis]|uniref:response regulator n=1 Tax=Pseudomonas xanthosomatis TaxID=2842356 RepID=UPI001CED578F|nr:response regulator [Pseudomonas xanthosomatis]